MNKQHETPKLLGALNPDHRDFHEVANIFPMLGEAELQELADDIKKHGLREHIWLHEEKIIDGRNRFLACEIAGVKPLFREWRGIGSLIDFVVSINLHRRHLTESQRAMVAAKIANMGHGDTGRFSQDANLRLGKVSQSQAAEKLNVSHRLVNAAAKVQKEAAPEVRAAVEAGAVTISAAVDMTPLPKEEQSSAVAGGREAVREAAKKGRETKRKPKEESSDELSIEEQIEVLPLAQALALYGHKGHLFRQQAEIWHVLKGAMASVRVKASLLRYTKGPVTAAAEIFYKLSNPAEWEGCQACKGSLRVGERFDPCNLCHGVGFTTLKGNGVSADEVRIYAEKGLKGEL